MPLPIEIKHFRYSPNEAVTDNRFAAILDLRNLEQYQEKIKNLLCYEVIYTDNKNYTIRNRSKFEISGLISGTFDYTKERSVTLENTYNADWDCYDKEGHYFLKIGF